MSKRFQLGVSKRLLALSVAVLSTLLIQDGKRKRDIDYHAIWPGCRCPDRE